MKKFLLVAGVVVLLMSIMVLGAFFTAPSLVQAKSSSSLGENSATATDPYCQAYQRDLANRLHVSVTALEQAQQAAFTDSLNQMVKDGKLTQKQATAIQQHHQSHMMCNANRPMGMPSADYLKQQFAAFYSTYVLDTLAPKLRLSSDQLNKELRSGKSLSEIATAQHISQTQLNTIVNDAVQNDLKLAVRDGNLTQSQANYLWQQAKNNPNFVHYIVNFHNPYPAKKAA